ncbi:MAG: GntR family transcriptional regulator [Oscillospiraceae bacterium]|nr:GntR family transcriptional regulator [Oscillospiraceae bacterium]
MPVIDRNSNTPVFRQIYKILRSEITGGIYNNPRKLPSEKELKLRFGVERNTVRNALKLLADEDFIIKAPGYGSKISAEKRAGNKNILFITRQDEPQNDNGVYFHTKLLDGFGKISSHENYNLIYKSAGGDFDFANAIQSSGAEAVIFDSYNRTDLYNIANNLNIPRVSVNHYTPLVTSVVSNNFDGSYKIAELLHEAGHRRVAFITGKEDYQTTVERLGGVQSYYMKENIYLDKKYIIRGEWRFESGFAAGEKILAMKPEERPTAAFAFNDDMAFGCLSCFEKRGVSVPGEISLAGFDKSDRYASIFRPITTVDINIEAIIKYAYWYLLASIQKSAPSVCVKIQIDAVVCDNGTVKNINI